MQITVRLFYIFKFCRIDCFYFIINIGGHSVDSQGTEIAGGFSQDICLTLFKDLIKPLHYTITSIMIYGKKGYFLAFGDAFCDDYIKKMP